MTAKRLVAIASYDPNDVTKWSGIPYFIYKALTDNAGNTEVIYVRGLMPLFVFAARAVNRLFRQLGIKLECRFSTAYAMLVGVYLTARLRFMGPGTLLFIAGSDELAYLRTNRRVIYISDATFRVIAPLYSNFRALPKWLQEQGDRNEARSLSRADFIIYPSNWAADSARRDYGVPDNRIYVLPFGPNIPEQLIHYAPKAIDPEQEINILFIGVDWVRKNGDLVLVVCQLLKASGLKVRLVIAGDIPERVREFEFVNALGPLRKSVDHDLSALCDAFRDAHFFLLPTVADAFGVVFVEAQAYGVPQLAFDVGGVGSAVIHDKTGLLLPVDAPAEQFAQEILRCVNDSKLYAKLSRGSREHYLQHANWRNWSRLILELANR
jgi:glycosyltransferase involved in cell wall biosynthesis